MDKYTDRAVVCIIDDEGLGYAVEYYLNADDIKNPKLAKLWDKAQKAMINLRNYTD